MRFRLKRLALALVMALSVSNVVHAQFTSTAAHIRYGPVLPATCSPNTGDVFYLVVGSTGSQYNCTAVNTWSGAGSGPAGPAGPPGPGGPAGPSGAPGVPGYSPNTLLSGGMVAWTGNLNFTVSQTIYQIGGVQYTAPQTNITLAAADPSNPRFDVIAVNTSSAVAVLQGTPAANPVIPSINATTQLQLTVVLVPAGSTTPGNVVSTLVYDEDTGPTAEWTTTVSGGGFNPASTNNPYHGTKDIEATSVTTGNYVNFTVSPSITSSTTNYLVLNLRSKGSWSNKVLAAEFMLSGSIVGSQVLIGNGSFGFSSTNTTSYQQIIIPLTLFTLNASNVDTLRILVGGSGAPIGFYLDWITLQAGLPSPSAPTALTWCGIWNSTAGYATNCVVRDTGGTPWVATAASTNITPGTNAADWIALLANYIQYSGTTGVINLPSTTDGSPASGDFWNQSGSLFFYNGSLQTIAFLPLALSNLATEATNTVVMNATGGTAAPTAVAMPTCTSGADLYNTTTHSWSCVSIGGTTNQNIRQIFLSFDGGGSALSGTITRCAHIDYAGTIGQITVIGDQSGSATVKVLTVAYSSYTGPGSASDISNGGESLSSVTKLQDSTLTGWTTSLSAGTEVCGQISAESTFTWLSATLKIAASN